VIASQEAWRGTI